jgi:uncharacterized repeat protein (TIGR01451 family)
MINSQPYLKEKAKGRWQRKLSAAFVAASLLWLPVKSADAAITDTVTATGYDGTNPLTSTSTANVAVVPADPKFTVVKTATPNFGPDNSPDPGDTISYAFKITNTGNITLQNVLISDPGATITGAPISTLAPGATDTTTYTAVHVITVPDLQAGQYTNTATGRAHAISGADIIATASVPTPLNFTYSMTLQKTGVLNMGTNGQVDAGDTINYSFLVTNTGPTTLHNVQITDSVVTASNLGNNLQAVAMLEGARQQSDNIATASIGGQQQCFATSPISTDIAAKLNPTVPSETFDQANLNVTRQVLRMSGTTEAIAAGDKIGFVYSITNSGNVPLNSVIADQPDAVTFNGRVELLANNTTDPVGFIFTRNVTEEEITKGEIAAPATITAQSKARTLNLAVNDKLKVADIKAYDSITTASITPAAPQILTAGQAFTFNAIYTLTQADVDNGTVNNTATATALNVADQIVSKTDTFIQPLAAVPGVATIKTATLDFGTDNQPTVGDVITYHFAVTNTGNVTLAPVTMTDTKAVFSPTATIATLAPGATDTSLVATHALTAADLLAGQYQNQSTVTGRTPKTGNISALSDDDDLISHDPTIVQWPSIALIKTVNVTGPNKVNGAKDVNGNGFTDAGDTIEYTFKVINTGKFVLNNIVVTDPLMPTGISGAPLNGLAPGASDSTHFTGLYTITQDDVNRGHVDNTAKVEGTDINGTQVQDYSDPGVPTADAPTITLIPPHPVLTLVKNQSSIEDKNNNGQTDIGDVIHYTFTITNAGNLAFTSVSLVDLLPGAIVSGATFTNFAPSAQNSSYSATYTITSRDMTVGSVSNQARVNGVLANGSITTDLSDNADPTLNNPTVTPIVVKPAIALIKRVFSVVDTNTNGVTDVGDTINYTFDVRNTGNVPLTNVLLNDLLAGAVVTGGPILNLPAGNTDTTTFKASYALTASDITLGKVSNTARIFGTYGTTTVTDDSDNASYTANNPTVTTLGAGIAIVKNFTGFTKPDGSAMLPADFVQVDYLANYTFAVTNLGSGVINDVSVSDPFANVFGANVANAHLAGLAPGATNATFFTATHKVTAADLSAGGIYNMAEVQGTSASTNTIVSDFSDPVSIYSDAPTYAPIPSASGIALIKKMVDFEDNNGSGEIDVGDTLNYTFEVINTGNQDLINVAINDAIADVVLVGSPIAKLPAGKTTTITGTYVIKFKDAKAGQVSNTAIVHGDLESGGFVEDDSDSSSANGKGPTVTPVKVTIPVLTKVADKPEVKRGEVVTYTITASNLVPTPFNLIDVMPPGFNYVAGSATINGAPAAAQVSGRYVKFDPATPPSKPNPLAGKLILKLKLTASSTLSTGKFVNNAQLITALDGELVATAQATVTITEDAVFDCSDIIGRVFDDLNADGYMNDGEPGLPGVRVVTLNGLLITTDAEGRFHVPCGAIPDAAIGSNFLMKLDTRTLPTGYKLTTENPRDVRVTRGKVVKLNFGAAINHEVRIDITGKAFVGSTLDLTEDWTRGVDKVLDVLSKQHATLKIVYRLKGEDAELARSRAAAIAETIDAAWQADQDKYKLVITTSIEGGQ